MTETSTGEPDFTKLGASPQLAPFFDAAQGERWPQLFELLAGLEDPADRSYVVSCVSTVGLQKYLHLRKDKATGLETAMRANFETHEAWKARSSERAEYVTEWQWKAFRAGLVKSERLLVRLTAEEPGNALAWQVRILNSRGLELGQGETRRRYDRLAAIAPHHYDGQMYLFVQLLPKWGGSWQAAHGFARECALSSPPGSVNAELVADYHWEFAGDTGDVKALRATGVAEDLMEAARHSVLHKDFGRPLGWVRALSKFAFLFCTAGDHAAAAPFFRAMEGFGAIGPWSLMPGDPARNFVKDRDRALAKG